LKKYSWLYQIRGMAMIAVVVCHQQYLLHSSEWIQLLTLYSVTVLIFCAGITRSISLKRWAEHSGGLHVCAFLRYLAGKLAPILCSYLIATIAYLTLQHRWTGDIAAVLVNALLTFSASGPLYFIKYYVVLTCLSPILQAMVTWAFSDRSRKWVSGLRLSAVLILTFLIGCWSLGRLSLLGGSYLSVYTAGIAFGSRPFPALRKRDLPVIAVALLYGLWSTKQFYWARIAGDTAYTAPLDRLAPKLQMNPPNLSIILYSAGCFLLFYWIFTSLESRGEALPSIPRLILRALSEAGRYSLDIFVWHMLIQQIMIQLGFCAIPFLWMKRILFYGAMFFLPILGRRAYEKCRHAICGDS